MLREHDLLLRSDLLGYRAHWITPEFEVRRYDTRFFSAAVPQGQRADDDTTEADVADWVRPADLLQAWRRERRSCSRPTVVAVEEVAAATSARPVHRRAARGRACAAGARRHRQRDLR